MISKKILEFFDFFWKSLRVGILMVGLRCWAQNSFLALALDGELAEGRRNSIVGFWGILLQRGLLRYLTRGDAHGVRLLLSLVDLGIFCKFAG